MRTCFVCWASTKLLLPSMSLQCYFIQKCKDERETSLWQSNFSFSSIYANSNTQSPKYMSNSCLILPVNAHEYFRSVMPRNWCRNLIFRRVYYFLIKILYHCGILVKNILKTGMNVFTKWGRILHFQKHHVLRNWILQLVMFFVFWFMHFLCKSIHSRFYGMYQISLY